MFFSFLFFHRIFKLSFLSSSLTQLSFSSMLLGLNGFVSFLSFINCWKGEVEVNTDREKANLIRGSPGTQDAMLGVCTLGENFLGGGPGAEGSGWHLGTGSWVSYVSLHRGTWSFPLAPDQCR